jgi:hypothetical protein
MYVGGVLILLGEASFASIVLPLPLHHLARSISSSSSTRNRTSEGLWHWHEDISECQKMGAELRMLLKSGQIHPP